MSEYDAEMYESFSSRVRRQVQSLRVILESLQAKSLERIWLRHQTSGELDDAKLIEGLTGEKAIYKKRGEEDPEVDLIITVATLPLQPHSTRPSLFKGWINSYLLVVQSKIECVRFVR